MAYSRSFLSRHWGYCKRSLFLSVKCVMKDSMKTILTVISMLAVNMAVSSEMPVTYPAPASGERLTPPVSKTPSLNGASVFGVRPGAPFLHRLSASGERPLSFKAMGLPQGLSLDSKTGIITGKVAKKGDYPVQIEISNKQGKTKGTFTIKVGDTLCLTPPMGWNSWYSYSEAVSQEAILKTARLLVEKGLADHGWTYVNIDDCWQGERGGPEKAIQPNVRFPDMKAMCDEIHSLGLKAGIYSSPWMGTYAGFIGGSSPNAEGDYSALALPKDKRLQETQIYGRWPGLEGCGVNKEGAHWFFDKDARQWADWGFDYVKVDWLPNDVPTTERIAADLAKFNRDIVLSLSNAAPYENMDGLSKNSQLWRTTGDIHDSWGSISGIGFSQEKWQKYTSPGHWNDPDMLQVGQIGTPNNANTTFRPTRLTPDEQYTQVTLWSILSAPLLISSDLENMDDFTMGLLCNDDVIAIDQDPAGKPARKAKHDGDFQVWCKPLENGDMAVAFFNTGNAKGKVKVEWKDLGLSGKQTVRDLWRKKDVGTADQSMEVEVNSHGSSFFRLNPKK